MHLVGSHSAMRIVGIAGSFGKTTTKHFLYELIRFHYRTQMIPGTINTPSGIATWLMKELSPATEVLIVEMDAYKPGEIAMSADMTPPDIVIITNVGDQHLERFGTKKMLAASLGETITHARRDVKIIMDSETASQLQNFVGTRTLKIADSQSYRGTLVPVSHLSASNKENLSRVLVAAELLGIPSEFVFDTCSKLELPDRRQKSGSVYGYEGIDDSYNISLTTAKAGLAAARSLADVKGKKLFVVTAGIPEFGPEVPDSNIQLGKSIADSADQAIVLNSMFAPDVLRGIDQVIPQRRYARQEDFLKEVHSLFPSHEWVALFQPALPDLYY